MASLNTSQNGANITNSYQNVVNAPAPSGPAASSPTYGQWALYSVQAPLVSAFQSESGKESVLKVQTTGEGELIDLIEDLSDGRIQFAFVKIKDPNTGLPKNVLIAWCGEGVPERTKGYFTSHMNVVSKLLHGYHVQITARSDRDLTPESITQKVADSSGSRYSGGGVAPSSAGSAPPPPAASKPVLPTKSFGASGGFQPLASRSRQPQAQSGTDADGWGDDAPPVTRSQLQKVQSAYQPTKVNMGALQSQQEPSKYQAPTRDNDNSDVTRGGYQPVGKVDINAIRAQARDAKDDRPTVVKGAYEPVGKVDIAEIRRKAQGATEPAPAAMAPQPSGQSEEERPKSLADRSAAFTGASGGSERLTSMPKPAVANRFGSQASSFAGTRAPQPGGLSKPAAPSAAPVGTASKTFADEGGKTPAQIWAEKKARERGISGGADTQPSSGVGAPASPIQSQQSGGWQSGYGGKKWGVNVPARTGGSGVSAQRTGDDEPPPQQQEEEEAPSFGGVSAMRDQFKGTAPMGASHESPSGAPEPPPLDVSSKPNAGARGVPMPGLPQRPAPSDDNDDDDDDVPAEDHQTLPPPPPRGVPADEPSDDEDAVPQSQGSPVRIAMPVARAPEPAPLSPAEESANTLPTASLESQLAQHRDPSPEPQIPIADPARAAGVAAATSTFGAAEDPRAAESGGKVAVAQYDYEKAEENELELRDGERVTDIDMVDEDWWMGRNERGEVGLFPANYVELVEGGGAEPEPEPDMPSPAPAAAPAAGGSGGASASAGKTAIAQYDYEAAEENELSFPDGGRITDIEFPDDDWWLGSFGGKTGLFPANYVELEG